MNKIIAKYKIVVCTIAERYTFQQMVVDMLRDGWELQGGVCVDNGNYYQAMIMLLGGQDENKIK